MKIVLVLLGLFFISSYALDEWVIQLKNGQDPEMFAIENGMTFKKTVPHLKGYYLFTSSPTNRLHISSLNDPNVKFIQRQVPQKRYTRKKKLIMGKSGDPLYSSQWHLHSVPGVSVNAHVAWNMGLTGKGVVIGVVDDGLQHRHPDLQPNYDSRHSWDFNQNNGDPSPGGRDGHGTSAAGVAAAARNNGHCGSGVAPEATIVGLKAIAAPVTDYVEALALSHFRNIIDIYSCSWGPMDDGEDLAGPGHITQNMLKNSVENGRKGKGSIFVWAGGNGRQNSDNCNYDGYANSPYTIAIGALDHTGKQSYYSEDCAALMAVTPSSGAGKGITTTDLMGYQGYSSGECTNGFGGTSSATPLAAGIIALLLQKNPALTKRDVEHVLAKGATKVDPWNRDWHTNNRGYHHNHHYGFGNLVIPKLLDVLKHHTLVPKEKTFKTKTYTFKNNNLIPNIAGKPWKYDIITGGTGITFIEHVMLSIKINHPKRGEAAITLHSPEGGSSRLSEKHNDNHKNFPYGGWTFSTVRHWGESHADGKWTISIQDAVANNRYYGYVDSFSLEIRGY